MQRAILSGDEAVARGAWEAGVSVAAAYPGTPSTEILENISTYKNDIYCTWANNEKIAVEIAIGASIGGMRALAAMKHVGMNVASDPVFSAAYTGVNGGLVVVSADDPGCHSSQNEQDNRLYAPHAKIGMLEPSDSQECKDFTKAAFKISERFDLIMMIRMTTRVCHSKSIVTLGLREDISPKTYISDPQKYAMLPVNARKRHITLEQNLEALKEYSYSSGLNKMELNDLSIGIITSGISYMHAKEAFGDNASYLKLGITYPLSDRLIREFAAKVKKICVIEEGEGYLEAAVKALGIECIGKQLLGCQGELDAQKVREAFGLNEAEEKYEADRTAPPRPPVLCAGCPHRGFYYAMGKRRDKILAVGDIGCYSLGVNPPFNGFDIAICMGSGFSIPIGLSKALEKQNDTRKVFGILGDSTFFHSGFNSMVDAVHAKANVCLCVLDNSITAMTGHQENAGTQKNLMGYEVPAIDILQMVYSTGIDKERVWVVDPIDQEAMG
jgi:indolepyruvate ferredoxin oxidoreductase alpha subunit